MIDLRSSQQNVRCLPAGSETTACRPRQVRSVLACRVCALLTNLYLVILCISVLFLGWEGAALVNGQELQRLVPAARARVALVQDTAQVEQDEPPAEAAAEDDEMAGEADAGDEKRFPHGATLQTNRDIEEVLQKADRYMEEGNYRAASRFWQAAIQRAGDQLYSTDGELYFPLVRKIEEIIATLPPEGLQSYRIAADAEATEYLADTTLDRLTRLQKVVDLAFLSAQGDRAALDLASEYLDRYQAIPAEILLRRILEVYPDPSVPLDEVWFKLAVAYAVSGDPVRGIQALEEATRRRDQVTLAQLEQVKVMLDSAQAIQADPERSMATAQWSSSLGLGDRIQAMPDLPAGFLDGSLSPVWMFQHDFLKQPRGKFIDGVVYETTDEIMEATFPSSTQDRSFEEVCREWQRFGWRATSMPLVTQGQIVFKTQADLAVWPTESLRAEPTLRSINLNRYAPDEITKFILEQSDQNRRNFPAAAGLAYTNLETMQYFGDPLYQSMTEHNGVVYAIEGDNFGRDVVYRDPGRRNPVNAWSSPPTRDRRTFLSAYEISSGRTLWSKPFPLQETDTQWVEAAVVGPPVGFQDTVLVPVLASGRFHLVAVNATSGTRRWSRVICDVPQLQPSSTTLVQLALTGSDVFMVCGCGVLANVDASSGQIRWVRRYQRSVTEAEVDQANQQFFGRMNQDWQRYTMKGWSHDLAVVWGNWVIVAASDTNFLAGYRRGTGELVWKAPRAEVLGCTVDQWLGVRDGIIYATGPRGLIAYELAAEGRLYGTPQRLDSSPSGRGLITSQGILLPVQDHLELYDLKTLNKIKTIPVNMPTQMPIGSLVSDGQRLWVAAMNRLLALEPVTPVQQETEPK